MPVTTITHEPYLSNEHAIKGRTGPPAGRLGTLAESGWCRRLPVRTSLLLVLSSLLAIGACGGGLSEAEKRYNEGVDAQEAGRLEEAVELYTEAIELDPDLVEAYANRSRAYLDLGRFEEAVDDATKAIELDPDQLEVYLTRSVAYAELGRLDEAVQDAGKAIELEPEDARGYVNRALTYLRLGRYEDAAADGSKAIELDPEEARAYSHRSEAYLYLGRFDDAVRDAGKAIELDPDLFLGYVNRSAAYSKLGRFDEALRDANKAIELDPSFAVSYSNRSVAYTGLGRFDEALSDANKAIELGPELGEGYAARAAANLGLGRVAKVEPDLAKACDLGNAASCDLLEGLRTGIETGGEEILQQVVIQLEDLPAGFDLLDSRFDTLADETQFSDDPDRFQRALESWGFLLGHDRFYERIASDGLLEVDVEVWLHQDEEGAKDAFLDGALYVVYGDVTEEVISDFPALGDESEAYRLSGQYVNSAGDEIQADGYTVTIRVGRFLASFSTAWPAGQANRAEAERLAGVLKSRMESQAQ